MRAVIWESSAKLAGKKNNAIYIDFSYQSGVVLRVKVTQKKKYIRMELVSAKPLKKIWRIEWGPVSVAMLGPRAEWIFLARSDDFTLGMTPLEVNTVRDYAHFNEHGIRMTLRSYNQTTDRNISGEGSPPAREMISGSFNKANSFPMEYPP